MRRDYQSGISRRNRTLVSIKIIKETEAGRARYEEFAGFSSDCIAHDGGE